MFCAKGFPALVAMSVLSVGLVRAEILIEFVPVGNPQNLADTEVMNDGAGGFGSVDRKYWIGKYEVTAGQYAEFLDAVADDDPYGLYSTSMWNSSTGCKIERTGSPGGYSYSVSSDRADRPVNYVGFWDACRFANWLHNGQPQGPQGPETTERGAYDLDGYTGDDGRTIARNAAAKVWIPSEDEWYKAAYYDGVADVYYDYPTGTDLVPDNRHITPDLGNNANFYEEGFTIDGPYWTTEVGAFENSASPYGTFDQGGNVKEWTESLLSIDDPYRIFRGGSFSGSNGSTRLHANYRHIDLGPSYASSGVGFRVASIPEPGTLTLLAIGGLGLLGYLARKRP